jgi:hypothetical protein
MLAEVGGLVVKTSFSGYPLVQLTAVSKAHCSLFDLPKDYQITKGREAYEELRALQPELEVKLDNALAALREGEMSPEQIARRGVEPQLRELCNQGGYPIKVAEDLDKCIEGLMPARALIAKVTTRALDRFAKEAGPKFQEVLREAYITPICEKFAKK